MLSHLHTDNVTINYCNSINIEPSTTFSLDMSNERQGAMNVESAYDFSKNNELRL